MIFFTFLARVIIAKIKHSISINYSLIGLSSEHALIPLLPIKPFEKWRQQEFK